jgi:tetratricopeptide (TPR) repeat protein
VIAATLKSSLVFPAAFLILTLSGTVHNAQPHAKIHLTSGSHGFETTVDQNGHYSFTNLLPLTYKLHIEDTSCPDTSVILSKNQTLDVTCTSAPAFFDPPQFIVAGVTDNTYRGGHGSDKVLRSIESLSRSTAELSRTSQNNHSAAANDEAQGHFVVAANEYQRAAELDPSESNLFDWGAELLLHHAPEAAIEVFGRGARLYSNSTRLLLGLGAAFYAQGSYDDAARILYTAADKDPNDKGPYLFLAKAEVLHITTSPEYLERLARFARLYPNDADANFYYARALWNQHPDPANSQIESLLKTALAANPHYAPAFLQLGILYAGRNDYATAITNYQRAIDAVPDLDEPHYRLAEVYAATNQPELARAERSRYIELSKRAAAQRESTRSQLQQFVIKLKSQPQ